MVEVAVQEISANMSRASFRISMPQIDRNLLEASQKFGFVEQNVNQVVAKNTFEVEIDSSTRLLATACANCFPHCPIYGKSCTGFSEVNLTERPDYEATLTVEVKDDGETIPEGQLNGNLCNINSSLLLSAITF